MVFMHFFEQCWGWVFWRHDGCSRRYFCSWFTLGVQYYFTRPRLPFILTRVLLSPCRWILSLSFKKTKHILRAAEYLRDLVMREVIRMRHLPGKIMIADILTKAAARSVYLELVRLLDTYAKFGIACPSWLCSHSVARRGYLRACIIHWPVEHICRKL